jgi:hypothetical protein
MARERFVKQVPRIICLMLKTMPCTSNLTAPLHATNTKYSEEKNTQAASKGLMLKYAPMLVKKIFPKPFL